MTVNLTCEAMRDDVVALLYDDGDLAERSRARDHLAQCVPCRAEYAELKGVRKTLSGWNLEVAQPLTQAPASARWFQVGLAAAAGLILGIGVALAGRNAFLEGPAESAAVAANPRTSTARSSGASAQPVSYDELQDLLRTQESRHQAEIADLRRTFIQAAEASTSPGALKTASNASPATIERLLKASEERQARMFEARLAGLRTENDLQRQYDMAQIAAGLAYIDSRTGADAARTSELMKNLVRVTAKPQER